MVATESYTDALAGRPLDWKDFLAAATSMSAESLTEDVLFDLVRRLVIDSGLLAPFIQFNEEGYSRNVLYRDEKFEAICLCWKPGQATAVHNHGRSFGIIYVHEGVLSVSGFARRDCGDVEGKADIVKATDVLAAAGTLLMDRVGSIHRLGNPPMAKRRSVSLHFYAGPLDVMEIFDPLNGTVAAKPMQGEPILYIDPEADVMAAMI